MIVICFNHLLEVHAHMLSLAANMSSVAKICHPKTFDMVMKAAARLMIQINVPEHNLSPVQDPLQRPLQRRDFMAGEGPASLSSVSFMGTTVWPPTKCKFFNGSTAKEACTTFEVWPKQLSKLLSGKVYLGGTSGATKGK